MMRFQGRRGPAPQLADNDWHLGSNHSNHCFVITMLIADDDADDDDDDDDDTDSELSRGLNPE